MDTTTASQWLQSNDLIEFLSSSRFFQHLSSTQLERLASLFQARHYEPGEVILKAVGSREQIFFLYKGVVDVMSQGKLVLSLRRRGDLFGESNASEAQRTIEVIAQTQAQVCILPTHFLDEENDLQLRELKAALYQALAIMLTKKLFLANQRIESSEAINKRLAESLEKLGEDYFALQQKYDDLLLEIQELRSSVDLDKLPTGANLMPPAVEAEPIQAPPTQPRILVAEDEPISRTVLVKSLEKEGYEVLVKKDGREAWEALQQDDDIQMVILDWKMPYMDGLEVCRLIRQHMEKRYHYVCVLTAREDKDAMLQAFSAGADDYLTKPFDSAELQARLRVGLRLMKLEKTLYRQRNHLEEHLRLQIEQSAVYAQLVYFMDKLGKAEGDLAILLFAQQNLMKVAGVRVQFWGKCRERAIPLLDCNRELSVEKEQEILKVIQSKRSIHFANNAPRYVKKGALVMELLGLPKSASIDILPLYLNFVHTASLAEKRHHKVQMEQRRYRRLMKKIFPQDVAKELMVKGVCQPQLYESVTVGFTDFVGFTRIAEQWAPEELIQELENYFDYFDRAMQVFKVEKLKTIGDGYMYAGGLPQANSTHAIDCVLAALEIQKFVNMIQQYRVSLTQEESWQLRIGIHSGPVMAGVIGSNKFAYDIWGDTVNTASRMESNGLAGHINISEDTCQLVSAFFECIQRGTTEIKGKGPMNMYFVKGLRSEFQTHDNPIYPNEAFWDQYRRLSEH